MCHGSCTAWSDLMRLTEDVFLQMSRKIRQLENENHRLVRQAALQKTREATFRSHLHEFFTVDQLAALSRSSNRGSKWSNETVKKSLQMRSACGSLGYDLLLEGSFPLPSSRTLGRRLEGEHCPTGPQSLHGHCPALPGGESWLEHQLPHHGLVLGTVPEGVQGRVLRTGRCLLLPG
ncbi:uncharacterized protein LOC120850291 [Ixodes scapularis]|uniref:uncharacterized protein LOC120850291 n=1 Tax=Ixodes scapularis TaxID=6945 RepID=UPI001C38BAC9|nr:uncharacterized protein LOC120850291 [Ixodes scapularis]